MRAFIALVSREINERRALLAAAAVASLLPLLAPLLPSTGSNPAEDIREAVMWVILGGLAPLFALLLGVSFIGRDLAEGRMGFYYAQPLSGPTIWFGKLAAVVLLIWSVEIIVVLPTVILAPDPRHFLSVDNVFEPFMPKWITPLVFWIASAAIVLLVHAVGIVWRARSAWIVLDLIAALVVIGVAWLALEPALWFAAPHVCINASIWLVSAALVGLFLGGAAQVTSGRVDLRRCHHLLSATFWTILGVCAVAVFGWSNWIRSATIGEIRTFNRVSVGPGDWIGVDGTSGGRMDYLPRFLLNVRDGRSLSVGPAVNWSWNELQISSDGRRAVWLEFSAIDQWRLMIADLEKDNPTAEFAGVVLGAGWGDFSVSPDGSHIAVVEDNTVAVYGIDPRRQVMAAHIGAQFNAIRLRFDDQNELRVLTSTPIGGNAGDRSWRLFFVDIAARSMVASAELDSPWRWGSRSLDGTLPDRLERIELEGEDHLVMLGPENDEIAVDLGPMHHISRLRIMKDGLIVVVRSRQGDHQIEVYTPDAVLLHRIQLPKCESVRDGGEIAPDQILVGLWTWGGEFPSRSRRLLTSLVDLKTGEATTILKGFAPVLGGWESWSDRAAYSVGTVAGRLMQGEDGSLHLWDPETNRLRRIIPVPD
jgi:hypothetical protein